MQSAPRSPGRQRKKPEGGRHLPAFSTPVCMYCKSGLFIDYEFSPSVLGPGLFVIARNSRFFLAVADDGKAVRLNTQGDQVLHGGCGAALTQRKVILCRSALVTVTLDLD